MVRRTDEEIAADYEAKAKALREKIAAREFRKGNKRFRRLMRLQKDLAWLDESRALFENATPFEDLLSYIDAEIKKEMF